MRAGTIMLRSAGRGAGMPCAGGTATAVLALLLLAACGPAATPTAVPATALPTPRALALATPAIAPGELPVGVQLFEGDVTTTAVDQVRAAGATWARVRALWKAIEPQRHGTPRYEWAMTDQLLGAATAAGFRSVAAVYANPPWVTARECRPVPPEHLARYGALWTALVERYDGDGQDDAPNGAVVHYWQVSNEADLDPNAPGGDEDYGGCAGDDPAAYAEMLATAYRAAKVADPAVQVGFGPVAYDRFTAESAPPGWSAEPGPFAYPFTQQVLEHLHNAYAGDPELPFFHFVGLHNYNDHAHFWDGADTPLQHELVGKIARFRDEQLALPGVYDLRAMPILLSETGFASAPADEWTARDERLQAGYVGQSLVRAMAAGVLAAIWYTARDNIVGDCVPPHYDWLAFGLMRSDYYQAQLQARCPSHPWLEDVALASPADPKPALAALATMTDALRGTAFERQLTVEETGSAAIEAYRFRDGAGRTVLAAWTTTGQRLGARGVAPITATLRLVPELVAPWTGRLRVLDAQGQATQLAGATAIDVPVGQMPLYARAEE